MATSSVTVTIRLTPDEKNAYEKLAEKNQLSLSEFIRTSVDFAVHLPGMRSNIAKSLDKAKDYYTKAKTIYKLAETMIEQTKELEEIAAGTSPTMS